MRDIERLLRGRRARRRFIRLSGSPTDDEAELIRMGIELRALRPGTDTPRDQFLNELRDKIAESAAPERGRRKPTTGSAGTEADAEVAAIGPADGFEDAGSAGGAARSGRRGFLAGASVAAASAVAAVAVDRAVSEERDSRGAWHRVLAAADLRDAGVRAFQAGAVSGFVTRHADGRLSAVSGACTHLGCRLSLSGDAARLDCPCHSTSFAVTGEVVHKQLPIALPPLPRFPVRETGGHIEVYLPL